METLKGICTFVPILKYALLIINYLTFNYEQLCQPEKRWQYALV